MTAGKLNDDGFSFHWSHGYLPCLVSAESRDLIVMDVFGGLPMIIKGGVFDRITDNEVLAELCGAKWLVNEGNSGIWFPVLSKTDNHEGLKLYKTMQGRPGVLNYARCETSALTAETAPYACFGNAKPADKEAEEENIEEVAGMKLLAFDISEKM